MKFNNDFKIIYWLFIVVALSLLLVFRLKLIILGQITNFDLYVLIFWFVIVLWPLFNEISIAGFTFKKEIKKFKEEIRSYILELKIDNSNRVNINIGKADEKAYAKKQQEELTEESKVKKTRFLSVKHQEKKQIQSKTEKTKERLKKIKDTESFIREIMVKKYGDNYRPEMKIGNNLGREVILDGIIFNDKDQIKEIVEIKFITFKSFDSLKYIGGKFIKRLNKIGIGIDQTIRFIIVSEEITPIQAYQMKLDLNFCGTLSGYRINSEFFKFIDGNLEKIIPQRDQN